MSPTIRNRIALVLGFLAAFCAYSLWEPFMGFLMQYVKPEKAEELSSLFFFASIEFAFMMYTYLIYLYAQAEGNLWNIAISKFVYITAFGALVDRIFFDPYTISLNDYLIYLLTLIILLHNVRTKTTRIRK